MAAVRVPPSASITSASIVDCPGAEDLHVDHGPEAPADQSLDLGGAGRRSCAPSRVGVLPGSIAYSAVSQPTPLPSRNGGTLSERCAVTSTVVAPERYKTPPGLVRMNPRSNGDRVEICSGLRPSCRGMKE